MSKIISLYIQKYRFEHYENNQDKYHEKLVLQRKLGRLRAVWGFVDCQGQIQGSKRHGAPTSLISSTGWNPKVGGAHPQWPCPMGQEAKFSTANNTHQFVQQPSPWNAHSHVYKPPKRQALAVCMVTHSCTTAFKTRGRMITYKLKASQDYLARPCLKENQTTETKCSNYEHCPPKCH